MTQNVKIFILTLPGDEARRQPLLDELDRQGVDYELFMGVDGRKGLPPEYLSLIDREGAMRKLRRAMTDGEFACALSHRAIYERVLSEGLDAGVVLEDDALLQPGFGDFLRAGGALSAPMLLLDYDRTSVSRFPGRRFPGGETLWRVVGKPVFATGYVVSPRAARQLVRATTPVRSVSDWPVDLHLLKCSLVSPRLVHHLPVGNPLSHLETRRLDVLPKEKQKKLKRRYLTWAYWRGYVRRRLSKRIDP